MKAKTGKSRASASPSKLDTAVSSMFEKRSDALKSETQFWIETIDTDDADFRDRSLSYRLQTGVSRAIEYAQDNLSTFASDYTADELRRWRSVVSSGHTFRKKFSDMLTAAEEGEL